MNDNELTDEQLDEIETRAKAATAGPWVALTTGRDDGDHWYVCDDGESIVSIHANDGSDEEQRQPDAEFIAHAREDVPALVAEIRRNANREREFTRALGFGDETTGKTTRLEDIVDSVHAWNETYKVHSECPTGCGECGEHLAASACDHCNGSGRDSCGSECGWCAGAGKSHVGCVGFTYIELVDRCRILRAENEQLRADYETVRAQRSTALQAIEELQQRIDGGVPGKQVTSAAELDALPTGAVILNTGPDGSFEDRPFVHCRIRAGYWENVESPHPRRGWTSDEIVDHAAGDVLIVAHNPGQWPVLQVEGPES